LWGAIWETVSALAPAGGTTPQENRGRALPPRRVNGRWAMIHRPMGAVGAHIWMSYSPDLRHWGGHRMILEARRGGWWDANKIGLSPPPIETPDGWLALYHGVRRTASGSLYRLGLALFHLHTHTHRPLPGAGPL